LTDSFNRTRKGPARLRPLAGGLTLVIALGRKQRALKNLPTLLGAKNSAPEIRGEFPELPQKIPFISP